MSPKKLSRETVNNRIARFLAGFEVSDNESSEDEDNHAMDELEENEVIQTNV